ncbi:metallophosphoesterase family protein [Tunicatimonas pelagia]|uniref:metallophosphoesterase family protein n=1 Tax=Tunicatimonas pelagia TaxID=931531 RepID=UPI0026666929|nr:metallophosphoesterase family protein [Tunicatimonas pelagia]WKN44054.1 metallophosphoesterase family protein [Tunicatimonas pelagia]
MLKVGLLSDTHGYLDPQVFTHFAGCDEIWHAGDVGSGNILDELRAFKPTQAVFGNIDNGELRQELPMDCWLVREGLTVWMTHIGGYPPKYNPRVRKVLAERRADLFICGHSHILKVMKDAERDNMLCLNPGAAGRQGFHRVRTILRFQLNNGLISELEAIELGSKSN